MFTALQLLNAIRQVEGITLYTHDVKKAQDIVQFLWGGRGRVFTDTEYSITVLDDGTNLHQTRPIAWLYQRRGTDAKA